MSGPIKFVISGTKNSNSTKHKSSVWVEHASKLLWLLCRAASAQSTLLCVMNLGPDFLVLLFLWLLFSCSQFVIFWKSWTYSTLGTPALWVPRGFARALYASLNLVASKIITFYPEVVAQIWLDPLWGFEVAEQLSLNTFSIKWHLHAIFSIWGLFLAFSSLHEVRSQKKLRMLNFD